MTGVTEKIFLGIYIKIMRNFKLFYGTFALIILLSCGIEAVSAEELSSSSISLSPPTAGNMLGYGDKEEGYLLNSSKKQGGNTLSLNLPIQGENLSIIPFFQKTSPTGFVDGYKSDFNLMNNGYGLEYGVGIGYTLPASQFYGIGDMKITFNLMPKMTQGSSFLFPRGDGLSRIELGVGYRPIDNAEVFIKYLTLRDVLKQQDIFSNLADAIEVGAQLAF